MSDGSSLTQISQCGSDHGGSVEPIESSSDTSEDNISDSQSISSSDRHSSIDNDPDDRKSPAVEQIAKDTGCCLYSGITALVVMVVLLGIILIVTGPVLGLSFPPLIRINPPVPPIEDNHLLSNQSELVNEGGYDYLDYPQTYHPTNDSTDPADFEDYNQEQDGQGPATTLNLTTSINETEDLASLSPEALRLNPKYVAYVPIPIKGDDEDEDSDDSGLERDDDDPYDTDHYDEEVTPRSSFNRRRPEAKVDKVILPILMVPAGSSGESIKTSQGADSWRSNEFSDPPPRRFDDDELIEDHYEDHIKPSSSLRIPGLSRFRNRNRIKRPPPPGIDFRMFGSLAPETRQYRPRNSFRNGPRDDYGRTTALSQRRIPPPYRPRINKDRQVEGRDGPSPYIRPPPRPHNRNQQVRFQQPQVWSTGQQERQRSAQQPSTARRPSYSYPKDAMSIQDIISYMTSLSHSTEDSSKNPTATDTGKVVWSSDSYHQAGRSRVGQSWPNVLPPPPGMTADSRIDSVQLSRNGGVNPYSFKLDVYPIRDSGGSTRQQSGNSNRYAPTSPQSYRQQSQDYRAQYYARPPSSSVESSGVVADNIDFGYKVRIPDDQRYTEAYPSRRPYEPNYRDELPVPLAYRPRPTSNRDESTTPKPKLVVHLNVFNNKENGGNTYRFGEDRHDQEDDYYSPSDVYRAVLRNNAAKRDHDGGDDSMMGGQSRVGYSDGSSSTSNGQSENLYENHNMAAMPTDHYYRSLRRPTSQQSTGTVGNYRRNFYPTDEIAEPLPIPMPVSKDNPAVVQEESTVSTTDEPPSSS